MPPAALTQHIPGAFTHRSQVAVANLDLPYMGAGSGSRSERKDLSPIKTAQ